MSFPTPLRARACAGCHCRRRGPGRSAQSADSPRSRRISPRVQTMTANFTQTDSRKAASLAGTLQLKRPGRIRFQYGRAATC